MSKSIEELISDLERQEKVVKEALDTQTKSIKENGAKIGKIAIAAGVTGLLAYGAFRMVFGDDDTKSKKKHRKKKGENRILTLLIPYAKKMLDEILSPTDKMGN